MRELCRNSPANEFAPVIGRPGSFGSPIRRWTALVLCLLLVWAFMFVLAPMMQALPPIRAIADCIDETGINASALYYTGVDETAEAEMYLYNAEKYAPAASH